MSRAEVPRSPLLTVPVAALLCGGRSRRMGRPKADVELAGRPLSTWVATTLEAITPFRLQVGGAPVSRPGWRSLDDRRPGVGPAAGLETALSAAAGAPVVLSAVDLPFVHPGLLRTALERVRHGALAAVPRWGGRWHPLCGVYAGAVRAVLSARLDAGRYEMEGLLEELGARPLGPGVLRAYGDPEVLLLNVNGAEDLERARTVADGGSRGSA